MKIMTDVTDALPRILAEITAKHVGQLPTAEVRETIARECVHAVDRFEPLELEDQYELANHVLSYLNGFFTMHPGVIE